MKFRPVLLIFSLVALSNALYAQSLQKKLELEVCNCFTERTNDPEVSTNRMRQCYYQAIMNLKDDFDAATDSLNSLGRDAGVKMEEMVNQSLINNCYAYIGFMDSLRLQEFKNVDVEKTLEELKEIKSNSSLSKQDRLYKEGELNFNVKRYGESLVAFKKVLKIDKQHRKAKLYVAWIYELQEEYDTALEYYNDAYYSEPGKILKDIIQIVEVKKNKKI